MPGGGAAGAAPAPSSGPAAAAPPLPSPPRISAHFFLRARYDAVLSHTLFGPAAAPLFGPLSPDLLEPLPVEEVESATVWAQSPDGDGVEVPERFAWPWKLDGNYYM